MKRLYIAAVITEAVTASGLLIFAIVFMLRHNYSESHSCFVYAAVSLALVILSLMLSPSIDKG